MNYSSNNNGISHVPNGTRHVSSDKKHQMYGTMDKVRSQQQSGYNVVKNQLDKMLKTTINALQNNMTRILAKHDANMKNKIQKMQIKHEQRIKLHKYRLRHTKSLNRGTHKGSRTRSHRISAHK